MMVSLRHAKVEEPFSFMVLEKKNAFSLYDSFYFELTCIASK
jgi:hypothetical protein